MVAPHPIRAVFDCTVFAQALINPHGPAGACLRSAQTGRTLLFISDYVLREIRELPSKLPARLDVTPQRVELLIADLAKYVQPIDEVPARFTYPRDPDDAHYVDLAVAADAMLIVSRDNDLLDLMRDVAPAAMALRAAHPNLRILTPPQFLSEVRA
jgi:putative PIN family toxin of toxin-antitoxin system